MSNLGGYQIVTTVIKQLGGPKLAAIKVGSLAFAGSVAVWEGGKWTVKKVRSMLSKSIRHSEYEQFLVLSNGCFNDLSVIPGDIITVLEQDDEAVLIAIQGRQDNPFIVSREWITDISAFKGS